jgi:hypothetical protein
LGIAVLGLFLVCGNVQAQDAALESQVPVQAPGQTGVGLQQEVDRLRVQVARLQLQLAQVRRQLAEAQAGQGVGGAGTGGAVGIGDPAAEAPVGATGLGDPNGEGVGGGGRAGNAQPDTDDQGTALVSAIYSGKLRSITQQQVVLEGEQGEAPARYTLGRNVRVLRNGREVSWKSLKQGTLVRISSDITAPGNPVTEIQVLERAG